MFALAAARTRLPFVGAPLARRTLAMGCPRRVRMGFFGRPRSPFLPFLAPPVEDSFSPV